MTDRDKALAKIIAQVAKKEQLRLVHLAIDAVMKDQTIDWLDRARIIRVIEGTVKGDPGRKRERPSDRAEQWLKVPAHRAANIAAWLERGWRRRNLVKNERITVGGKLVTIHKASARKAIQKCEKALARAKIPFKAPSEASVVDLLLRGRTSPF